MDANVQGHRVASLAAAADRTTTPRPGIARYHTPDGRRINLRRRAVWST